MEAPGQVAGVLQIVVTLPTAVTTSSNVLVQVQVGTALSPADQHRGAVTASSPSQAVRYGVFAAPFRTRRGPLLSRRMGWREAFPVPSRHVPPDTFAAESRAPPRAAARAPRYRADRGCEAPRSSAARSAEPAPSSRRRPGAPSRRPAEAVPSKAHTRPRTRCRAPCPDGTLRASRPIRSTARHPILRTAARLSV